MEYHSGGSLPLLGRPRYCPGATGQGGYLCETGHCCGETGCCTYYYELWWFWLLWTVLILFSCCCAYRHRRAKIRVQQQQRQRDISLLAYQGASSYPSSMLDLSFLASLKLPSYEEVAAQPSTPPPPYSSVFTAPRYPQPPRCSEPHLLTQHGALLHRPMSDGPSSLSSDNSSSCSCDSCCPSSLCSSSLSAPVTYETDTSHVTTPNEATPLTLDIAMETMAAAARCLELSDTQFGFERNTTDPGPLDLNPNLVNPSDPNQTGAVTLPASPSLPVQPTNQQLDSLSCTCTPSPAQSQGTVGPAPNSRVPAHRPEPDSKSDPSTPTSSRSANPTQTPHPTRPPDSASVPSTPTTGLARTVVLEADAADPLRHSDLIQAPEPGLVAPDPGLPLVPRNQTLGSEAVPVTPDPDPGLPPVPRYKTTPPGVVPVPPDPDPAPSNPTQVLDLCRMPGSQLTSTRVPAGLLGPMTPEDHTWGSDGPPCTVLTCHQVPVPGPTTTRLLLPGLEALEQEHPGPPSDPAESEDAPAGLQPGSSSGSGSPYSLCSRSVQMSDPVPTCPAITIESEPPALPRYPPRASAALSPPAPQTPFPLPGPSLLLGPLAALPQSNKGGSLSGQPSSLSPSPRTTQSPPKQTLFSPCVDVFEPEPPTWRDEDPRDDEDDDDIGADESQYRHRRLTGDSGIEVCRCRVEGGEEGEEEEEEGGERQREKRGEANAGLHDSVDCPARAQRTPRADLCNPAPSIMPTSEDKVVVVMETM
ncbi:nascent polypeptide-associated complex subunit alpha, muscle-specific form-like isoform X1 [Antennarius striatus]|uniref:nascent polypeptide-associated complex subunit alpha, muscle-specific form-like isoform X1 n=1 Tax=Antennarius striatus TaxID=241820 RepID=UPI0035B0B393